MRIAVCGSGRENHNYKKTEGFYNAFSKLGETEWIQSIKHCNHKNYDILFGEFDLNDIYSNFDLYQEMNIKNQIIWTSYDLEKIKKLANEKKETNFLNLYKSNILNKSIRNSYTEINGNLYQNVGQEGVDLANPEYSNIKILENLEIGYLTCALSEDIGFDCDKDIDLCYFGTIKNREEVLRSIASLSNKYNIVTHYSDLNSPISPDICIDYYKRSKTCISEQVWPVVLEYPVRMGECSAHGCRLFLIENISLKCDSHLVPDYTSCRNSQEAIYNISKYLEEFSITDANNLCKDFKSTYSNAVDYILKRIKK
jgi:hypothetical protein